MNFGNKTRSVIKKAIIDQELIKYECNECGIAEWNGLPLSLHLDHINGINDDNRLENLRFLCPNCHSQTDTYCGNNNKLKYGVKNQKVSDEALVESMRTARNPGDALSKVGLAGANNYQRVYRLAETYDIPNMKQKEKPSYSLVCLHCEETFSVRTKKESQQKFCSVTCYQHSKAAALTN